MTDDEIKRARELCAAATPGPWKWWKYGLRSNPEEHGPYVLRDNENGVKEGCERTADAEFIEAARTLLPRLLDEVEWLRSAVAAKVTWHVLDCPNHKACDIERDQLRTQLARAIKALREIEGGTAWEDQIARGALRDIGEKI